MASEVRFGDDRHDDSATPSIIQALALFCDTVVRSIWFRMVGAEKKRMAHRVDAVGAGQIAELRRVPSRSTTLRASNDNHLGTALQYSKYDPSAF